MRRPFRSPFRRPRLPWPPPKPGLEWDIDRQWGEQIGETWGYIIGMPLIGIWTIPWMIENPSVGYIILGVVGTLVLALFPAIIFGALWSEFIWDRGRPKRAYRYRLEYEATGGKPGQDPRSPWWPAETREQAKARGRRND